MFYFSVKILISLDQGSGHVHRKMEHQICTKTKFASFKKNQSRQMFSFWMDFEFRFPDICIYSAQPRQQPVRQQKPAARSGGGARRQRNPRGGYPAMHGCPEGIMIHHYSFFQNRIHKKEFNVKNT